MSNFEKRLKCWNRSTPGLFCLKLFSKFTMLVVISCSPQKSFLSRNLITFLSSEQQAPLLLGCFASSFGLIRLAENLWPQNILWHYDTIVMTASRNSIEATMWGGVGGVVPLYGRIPQFKGIWNFLGWLSLLFLVSEVWRLRTRQPWDEKN